MTEDLHQIVGELTDAEFEHLYGPLGRITPRDAADLFDGIDAPWWIVGGWAIEAFTGQQREHEDLDVCVLARDVPRLVEHFVKTHHVWATGGGVMFWTSSSPRTATGSGCFSGTKPTSTISRL